MRFSKLIVAAVVLLSVGFITSCEQGIEPQETIKFVKVNPAFIGLAKGELLTSTDIDSEIGATLTSEEMSGNYIDIPAGALKEDMTLTFSITVDPDGVLIFGVEGDGVPVGEHIYFNENKTSTIAVNKDWLSATPEQGVNYETLEQYDVTDGDTHWLIEVPHFSLYAWIITD